MLHGTHTMGSRDSLTVEHRTRDRKVASSNPGRSGRRIFFSKINFLCWLLHGVRSTTRVTAVARKRPRSFCQKCRWQLNPNTQTSLTYEVGVGWLCRCSGIVWEPIKKRARTQLARVQSATVVSARWATMDRSWPKEWNYCARANVYFKKKN